MGETFGFNVEHRKGGWRVFLPHQCAAWDIAGEKFDGGEPHGAAVAALERFIAEANAALAALRTEQEFGDPDDRPWESP